VRRQPGARSIPSRRYITEFPALLQAWDYNQNKIVPTELFSSDLRLFYWRCQNNHSWEARIASVRYSKNPCPVCDGHVSQNALNVGYNDVLPADQAPTNTSARYIWACEKGLANQAGYSLAFVWGLDWKNSREQVEQALRALIFSRGQKLDPILTKLLVE
jgi:hypothetical protein